MIFMRSIFARLNNDNNMTKTVSLLALMRLVFVCIACLLSIATNNAFAAGTAANTSISNTATLNYDVSGVYQPSITSPAAVFVVDNKINLTVIESDNNPTVVTPLQNGAVTTFTITNNGNATQDYALTGGNVAGTPVLFGLPETFNANACSTFVDNGANAGYQVAQDTANFIDELAADASATVYVVCNIGAQASSEQAVIELTAATRAGGTAGLGAAIIQTAAIDNPAAVDVVFADPATLANGSGTLPIQIARDAQAFARDAYRVAATLASVIKTAACQLTPSGSSTAANCGLAKTGTVITYQLQINVTGTGSVAGLVIADPLPSDLTYVPNSITVNAGARTDSIDADNSQFSTNTVTVILGTVAAPSSFTILFKASIN
jgi:uncharacterized repeat protein (TIGR01451 family)